MARNQTWWSQARLGLNPDVLRELEELLRKKLDETDAEEMFVLILELYEWVVRIESVQKADERLQSVVEEFRQSD